MREKVGGIVVSYDPPSIAAIDCVYLLVYRPHRAKRQIYVVARPIREVMPSDMIPKNNYIVCLLPGLYTEEAFRYLLDSHYRTFMRISDSCVYNRYQNVYYYSPEAEELIHDLQITLQNYRANIYQDFIEVWTPTQWFVFDKPMLIKMIQEGCDNAKLMDYFRVNQDDNIVLGAEEYLNELRAKHSTQCDHRP